MAKYPKPKLFQPSKKELLEKANELSKYISDTHCINGIRGKKTTKI